MNACDCHEPMVVQKKAPLLFDLLHIFSVRLHGWLLRLKFLHYKEQRLCR